jgi:hypothetical protein
MNKTFFLSLIIGFMVAITLGLPLNANAGAGIYNLIDETDTTYAVAFGSYSDITNTGYGGHSYRSSNSTDINYYSTMLWKCKDAFSVEKYWHTYVAVPFNTGITDGTYTYYVNNTNNSEDFYMPLNQELFANKWVYLGWSKGTGGINNYNNCSVSTNALNAIGTPQRQFWADHMKYWPNSSATAPALTHGW